MNIQTTRTAMLRAILDVSAVYSDNIRYRRMDEMNGRTVDDTTRTRYRTTITVANSSGDGASLNPYTKRRISAACWHVHGDYFVALLHHDPVAVIRTALSVVRMDGGRIVGNWRDYPRGSTMYPSFASEWCECGSTPDTTDDRYRLLLDHDVVFGRLRYRTTEDVTK